MRRLDALTAIYPSLEDRIVVTIMGAVAAELQSIGHRSNVFYLRRAMGLASSWRGRDESDHISAEVLRMLLATFRDPSGCRRYTSSA